jgi:hypothetical protein
MRRGGLWSATETQPAHSLEQKLGRGLLMIRMPAMFPDEVLQGVRIGLRPDGTASQAGVTLRIERCAVGQGEGQETKLIRPEHKLLDELTM